MIRKGFTYCAVFFLLVSMNALADLESTATLPEGVRSPLFLFGVITGLTDHYTSDGRVESVGDRYHLQLTGPTLSKLDSGLAQLVTVLNNVTNQQLGNKLSLGTLDLKANPVVDYFAPQFAYGLTSHFSVGVGVPVIHYRNDMGIVAGGTNNVAAIQEAIGNLSQAADAALNQLANINLVQTLQQVIASRGYKPIRPVDFTAMGDVVVSGVYQWYTSPTWRLALRPFVQVPTGTKQDPDDLTSVATGGQPAVGLYTIHDYALTSSLMATSSVGYQANVADTEDMRVPSSSTDILPGPDRKDTVSRHTGNSTYLEGGLRYKVSQPLEVGGYYDITYKDPDWYTGSRPGWDYGVLSNDTGALLHQFKAAVTFSTTDWFTNKIFAVPFQALFVYGTTIYGENSPYSSIYQMYLRMFF